MKYILDKEELEAIKTKLLACVSDFFVDLAENEKGSVKALQDQWPKPYGEIDRNRYIYIRVESYKESIEKLRDKLAESINNL